MWPIFQNYVLVHEGSNAPAASRQSQRQFLIDIRASVEDVTDLCVAPTEVNVPPLHTRSEGAALLWHGRQPTPFLGWQTALLSRNAVGVVSSE